MKVVTTKLILALLVSAIQFSLAFSFHNWLYILFPIINDSIAFGMTIYYTWLSFAVNLSLCNTYIIFNKRFNYFISILAILIASMLLFNTVGYRPLRSSFFIVLIILTFASSIPALTLLRNRINKKNEE